MLIADRYEIDDLPLGRGGMGSVHRGRDLRLDRRVAVKLLRLPGSDDEVQHRFAREARIVAKGVVIRVVLDPVLLAPAAREDAFEQLQRLFLQAGFRAQARGVH